MAATPSAAPITRAIKFTRQGADSRIVSVGSSGKFSYSEICVLANRLFQTNVGAGYEGASYLQWRDSDGDWIFLGDDYDFDFACAQQELLTVRIVDRRAQSFDHFSSPSLTRIVDELKGIRDDVNKKANLLIDSITLELGNRNAHSQFMASAQPQPPQSSSTVGYAPSQQPPAIPSPSVYRPLQPMPTAFGSSGPYRP